MLIAKKGLLVRWWFFGQKEPKVPSVTTSVFVARLSDIVTESADDIKSLVLSYVGDDAFIVHWTVDQEQQIERFRIERQCPHCVMRSAIARMADLVCWSNARCDELLAVYAAALQKSVQTSVHFVRPIQLENPDEDVRIMLSQGWNYQRLVRDAYLETEWVCDGHRVSR